MFAFSVLTGYGVSGPRSGLRIRNARVSMCVATPESLELSSERLAKLPWEKSIAGDDVEMLFMPFIELQNKVMFDTQKNLKDLPFESELSFQSSSKKKAKIESWNFQSDTFRKIRLTYIDAGIPAQVFNSVWYPDPKYDLPLLGVDFLSFGKKKILCVLDFQPLKQEKYYLEKYCEILDPVKSKYPSLAGQMTARFYDENQFFSKQLAFGRFDNPQPVMEELFPAFEEYLNTYVKMFKDAPVTEDPKEIAANLELQKEYDIYSAERDPAVGLFSTYFGGDWAVKFTHDFLFELSETPDPAEGNL
ncbi:hypothetical protein NDN08_001235 [Rhodosorus marinus]|uniref:15,16-dihydrobiliverdin:ferredoxin oxidoreductase n=1 Tax=Rhodosorus marinus TaxID=101924 RepID=A0AAV8UUF2_9RHOD|nr:hypothetical protein NDN08_001235 [Rhodosorus marinus]